MEEATVLQEFVGRKVQVSETEKTYTSRRDSETIKYSHFEIVEGDETLRELQAEAAKSGHAVRVWLPNSMGTCDFRMDRLNVRIDKAEDGTYSITKVYVG